MKFFFTMLLALAVSSLLVRATDSAPLSLQINGTKYEDVVLSAVDTNSFRIVHRDGVANFPLAILSKEQILALNKTSSTVQIHQSSTPDISAKSGNADHATLTSGSDTGDFEKLAQMIKDDPDLVSKKVDKDGRTLLQVAAKLGNVAVAQLLLSNGADVNARANQGYTALHSAAFMNHKEMVELLLMNKANIEARNSQGMTPLFGAAIKGNTDVVQLLIANRANVNAQDSDGASPLYVAVGNGQKDVVELLLKNGADINAKTKLGFAPLDTASFLQNKEIVNLLLRYGAK